MHSQRLFFRRSPRAAFTLVEMLVVIAIVAILIALLIPSLSRAQYAAKIVVCQAQLKQVGTGLLSYTSDFKDNYPRRGVDLTNACEAYILAVRLPGFGISADDRPLYTPYMGSLKLLNCALAPGKLDFAGPLPANGFIEQSYEFWAGTETQHGDPTTRMFKVGQRPMWAGKTFAILASDKERRNNAAWGIYALDSAHPDFTTLTPSTLIDDPFPGDPFTYTWSMYQLVGSVNRGPIDRNFLKDDGSVFGLSRLTFDDPRLSTVPDYGSYPPSMVSAALPPVE